MSSVAYLMPLETRTKAGIEREDAFKSKDKAIFEFKSEYLHKLIDGFQNYLIDVDKELSVFDADSVDSDGFLDSKGAYNLIKSRSRKILIKDWITNNLYGSEFENFVDLFNGNSYDPEILNLSEKKLLESQKDVIPLLNETYNFEGGNGIPMPKADEKRYRDFRALILSEITQKNGFVFAEYNDNDTKVYFKEDFGSTLKDAIAKLTDAYTSNGLVKVYGLINEMDGEKTLNVQIDGNEDIRAGKIRASSIYQKYL